MTTNSEELPIGLPIMALTFDATKEGFQKFHRSALIADKVGYDLVAMTPLGTKSFGAVWKKVRVGGLSPTRDVLGVEADLEVTR